MKKSGVFTTDNGFTVVEIAIVVPILIVISLTIFQALFMIIQSSDRERALVNLSYEKSAAMDQIESDVRIAALFVPGLDTNTDNQDPNESASSQTSQWSYKGGGAGDRNLILREYATSASPLAAGREPIFLGSGTACADPSVATNKVQTYNLIYFVKDNVLYRRHVVDYSSARPTCDPEYQKTSCPIASATVSCPADEIIATDVSAFDLTYYATGDPSASPINVYASGANQNLVLNARSVKISLTQSRRAGTGTADSTISLRAATLNQYVAGGSQ